MVTINKVAIRKSARIASEGNSGITVVGVIGGIGNENEVDGASGFGLFNKGVKLTVPNSMSYLKS